MKKAILFVLCFMLISSLTQAHVIQFELNKMKDEEVFWKYILIGFEHIIPLGFDHILFILCVFFLNTDLKQIILQASMFTIAHSITLALAMYEVIRPPANIIEPLIALSIVFLALENIFSKKVKPWRLVMVFIFGLVHGMGFASALSDLGLPRYAFANALISFNIGVELGQLTIILFMYLFVARLFSQKRWYKTHLVMPASVLIAIIAGYWTIERVFM